MAFEALEAFPALAESRDRLLAVISKDHVATAEVVAAVESDVALIIAVLRLANASRRARRQGRDVVDAVEHPQPRRPSRQFAAPRPHLRLLRAQRASGTRSPDRFRLHALATQHAADRSPARSAMRTATG